MVANVPFVCLRFPNFVEHVRFLEAVAKFLLLNRNHAELIDLLELVSLLVSDLVHLQSLCT
jgi:hypothetical protein